MQEISYATETDIPVIRSLTQRIWPVTYYPIIGEQQVAYMLDLFYTQQALAAQMVAGQVFLLCDYAHETVGFASYSLVEPRIYKINKLYVLHEKQGLGLGKLLLQRICSDIKALGATHLRLNVNIYNSGAIAFYERIGFYKYKDEDIDIGGGYFMNDFVFEIGIKS